LTVAFDAERHLYNPPLIAAMQPKLQVRNHHGSTACEAIGSWEG
jgi:hypothetical protein